MKAWRIGAWIGITVMLMGHRVRPHGGLPLHQAVLRMPGFPAVC